MKIAVITDTHGGYSSDNPHFNNIAKRFYEEIFFPCIDEYEIDTILHLGDIVERRKYINFLTLHRINKDFLSQLKTDDRNVDMWIIPGNHDVFHKNTNEICGPWELWGNSYYDIEFLMEPTVLNFGDCQIAMVPWICDENRERVMEFIKTTSARCLFGHFELRGFEWYKGMVSDHGDDPSILSRFSVVASGHYHHKSTKDNIHYLGSPFQLTWNDHNDLRGFHIFDTDTLEFEFIPNPFEPFKKLIYNDEGKTLQQMLDFPDDMYKEKFVKVVVQNKSNPFIFDQVIDKLEGIGPLSLQVVEDHMNADIEDDDAILSEAEDTLTTLRTYIDMIPMGVDKKALEKELHDIYSEALTLQE